MENGSYRSMKELITRLRDNLEKLEKGELEASALYPLTDDSRELYERLVVLRYKAHEKSSTSLLSENPVSEVKQEESRVITPFKLTVNTPQTEQKKPELVQTSLLDTPEVKPEQKPVQQSTTIAAEVSLNDKMSAQQKVTLAEKLQKKPIADLKTAIGLNQKFLFMNDLFEGENGAYNEAVALLNGFSTLDDAKNCLLSLGTKYNWDLESDSVVQFTDLIERRYA